MRTIPRLLFLLLFLPCLLWADFSHAQEKTDHRALQSRYHSYRYRGLVDSSVVRFINDDFVDDDSTEYILDDLLSSQDSLRSPFYFHVMSQLLWDTRMNPSFSEVTGDYQIRILANNPKQILHELMRKSSGTHEDPHWRSYAHDLGNAISFVDNNLFDPELYDTNHIQLRSYDDLARLVRSTCSSKSELLFCARFLKEVEGAWRHADIRTGG